MTEKNFVHLHVHTDFSVLDGMCRVPKDNKEKTLFFDKIVSLKMPAVAITDHGNVSGAIAFYKACQHVGVKPIIGTELYMADDLGRKDKDDKLNHLILLAKNEEGYHNLLKLVSFANKDGFYYKPRVSHSELEQWNSGLVCLTGCLQGKIPQLLLRGDLDGAKTELDFYRQIYGSESVFVEVQDHNIDDEIRVMPMLIELAKTMGVKVVATNDSHYVNARDAVSHEILLCIQTGSKLSDEKRFKFSSDQMWFKDFDEMREKFDEEYLTNTLEVAEQCDINIELGVNRLPSYNVPSEFGSEYEYLASLVREGATKNYGEYDDKIRERIEYELSVIEKTGFSGYFLIVWDIIKYAVSQGIAVSPGRGSASGAIVSYCLGITNVDPMRFNLLFERFLTADRISPPDIDTDFQDSRRGEVVDYIKTRWGENAVSQIITFGSLGARSVVRDVGRVLGVDYSLTDKLAKAIPETAKDLNEALRVSPDLRKLYDEDFQCHDIIDKGLPLEGVIRNIGMHAAGLVVSPGDISDYAPMCRSKNELMVGYDMNSVTDVGLLKIDILGLKTLTLIEDTLSLVDKEARVRMRELDDPAVFAMIAAGKGEGVFQFETDGMRDLCQRGKVSCIEDLMAINALYRPGPLGSGMVDGWINSKVHSKEITYIHPKLEPILKDTYGVFLYQEQIMQMAQALAGFTLAEGDILRKIMSKGDYAALDKIKPRFLEGAKANGVDTAVAEQILNIIIPFADYCFNKPHATAYAVLAYQTAYLKYHYPLEFWASCLTSESNDPEKISEYITVCRKDKINFLLPDVNESKANFTIRDGSILYGLAALKNVGIGAAKHIEETRDSKGAFVSLTDFCNKVNLNTVNKKVIESLIKAGCFDKFGHSRAEYMSIVESISKSKHSEKKKGAVGFWSDETEDVFSAIPALWSDDEQLEHEKDALGFYLSGNPLNEKIERLSLFTQDFASDMTSYEEKRPVIVGGIITVVRDHIDKKGNRMAFIKAKDKTGEFEMIVFADLFKKQSGKLKVNNPVIVIGSSSLGMQLPKIIANQVYELNEYRGRNFQKITIEINDENQTDDNMEFLKNSSSGKSLGLDLYLRMGDRLIRTSANHRIEANWDLIDRICDTFGAVNVHLA